MEGENEVGPPKGPNRFSRYSLWGIPVGLILIAVYFGFTSEVQEGELVPLKITVKEVSKFQSEGKTAVRLVTDGGEVYDFSQSLWADKYQVEDLVARLKIAEQCTLWVDTDVKSYVFGLKAETLYIPPSRGVSFYNSILCLVPISGIIFIVIPLASLLWERLHTYRKKEDETPA